MQPGLTQTNGAAATTPLMLAARRSYKMCLDLIFPWTPSQTGLPGSGGAAMPRPQNHSVLGPTAGVGEGGVFGGWSGHPLGHFSSHIFPRSSVAIERIFIQGRLPGWNSVQIAYICLAMPQSGSLERGGALLAHFWEQEQLCATEPGAMLGPAGPGCKTLQWNREKNIRAAGDNGFHPRLVGQGQGQGSHKDPKWGWRCQERRLA